jgi:AcrR family transcriptional regulator
MTTVGKTSEARAISPRKRSRRGLATRDAILNAAEALIAEHGLAGVSVAQIAREADQLNRGAIQYYFASVDELAMAVMARRLPQHRERRVALLREIELAGRGDDIRALVEVQVLPSTAMLGSSGSIFRFVHQLVSPDQADRFHWIDEPDLDLLKEWEARVRAAMPALVPAVQTLRIHMALDLFAVTLASLEAQVARGAAIDVPLASRALIDAMTAILTQPI